jgi:hypothetical protein
VIVPTFQQTGLENHNNLRSSTTVRLMESDQRTHRFWGYHVVSYWGPRRETPEQLAPRFLQTLETLAPIDPLFRKWFVGRTNKRIPFGSLSDDEIEQYIAAGVSRADDGDPTPQMGYLFRASNGAEGTPRSVGLYVNAGSSARFSGYINVAAMDLRPLNAENESAVSMPVLKAAVLALAAAWDVTWCSAYPATIMGLWPKLERRSPLFRMAWMSYLSARFAPMVTPPPTAIVERVPGGGLLMIATAERFSTDNPAHVAVARDIYESLAPVNALPWPPDA